jgi:hypothetical protein
MQVIKMENNMLICLSRRPANAGQRIWGARILAGGALMMGFFATAPAFALPSGRECAFTRYYSTAKEVTEVGYSVLCAGSPPSSSGKKTRFFKTITFRLPAGV